MSASPFSDLRHVLSQLPSIDTCAVEKNILESKTTKACTMPDESDFSTLKVWLSGWQGRALPTVDESHICILASSYEGYEKDTVKVFISAAAKGNAPVNTLCIDRGVGLRVLELAPELPYDVSEPWQEAECMAAVAFGMEAAAAGGDLLGLSDFAVGNMAPVLAILAVLDAEPDSVLKNYEVLSKDMTFSGGPPDEFAKALSWIKSMLATVGAGHSPLKVMQLLGGREVAASVGALIAARSRRLPVIVDGWAGIAAIAIIEAEHPGSADHVKIASCNNGLAAFAAKKLKKIPLIAPYVSVGAGCGVAIAGAILKAACDVHVEA